MLAVMVLAFLLAVLMNNADAASYCYDNVGPGIYLAIQAVNEVTGANITRVTNLTATNGTNSANAFNASTAIPTATQPACFNMVTLAGNVSGLSSVSTWTGSYLSRTLAFNINASLDNYKIYYLLSSGSGIYHSIYITTQTNLPLSGATVIVSKNIGSYYVTISEQNTDATGLALNYLDSTTSYRFVVSKTGYSTETFTSIPNPVNPVIYVKLSGGNSGTNYANYSTIFSNLTYEFLPGSRYQNVTFNATFEIVDPDSKITFQKFNATYSNGTLLCSVIVTTEPGGTLEVCSIPFKVGAYCVQGMIARTGFDNYTFNPICYWVVNTTAGLGGLDLNGVVSDTGYFVIALVITIIICAFLATFGGGVVVAFAAVGMFAFFAALKPGAMIGIGIIAVPFWAVVALMGICVASLMVLRSYI